MTSRTPSQLVEKRRARVRRTPLLWSLACVFGACIAAQGERLGWWPYGAEIVLFLCAPALGLILHWYFVGRRLTTANVARHLDSEWSLQSRLESSVELKDDPTALAAAQRSDAQERAQAHGSDKSLAWTLALWGLIGLGLILATELGVLARIGLTSDIVMHGPGAPSSKNPAAGSQSSPEAEKNEQAKRSATPGRISWLAPDSEIKATAIEDVLLKAVTVLPEGFEKLTLEIAVNGEARQSLPVDPATLAKVAKPGSHEIELFLRLEEVKAKEFEIVSYHLRGEGAPGKPVVNSPLQFVQIRPLREKTEQGGDGSSDRFDLKGAIRLVKTAQVALLKQNFQLSTTSLPNDTPASREAKTQLAADQGTLASKTTELKGVAADMKAPPMIGENLGQAAGFMREATEKITAEKFDDAGVLQSKALARITETERFDRKASGSGRSKKQVADPFKDLKEYPMDVRSTTPAGRLEDLSHRQDQLAQKPAENASEQTDAQKKLLKDLEALVAEKSLDPDVQEMAAAAAKEAGEAVRQLTQGDAAAARSPAAAAAEALARAVAEQDRKGKETALAEIDHARRTLTQEQAPSAQLQEIGNELSQAAANQQQTGSAEAASVLSAAGDAAREAAGKREGSAGNKGEQIAQTLADAEAQLRGRTAALARAGKQLKQVEKQLSESTPLLGGTLEEAQLGGQMAETLFPNSKAKALARDVKSLAKASYDGGTGKALGNLKDAIHRLNAVIEETLAKGAREEVVRRFNPEDVDPAYRSAIERYYERLSREGSR